MIAVNLTQLLLPSPLTEISFLPSLYIGVEPGGPGVGRVAGEKRVEDNSSHRIQHISETSMETPFFITCDFESPAAAFRTDKKNPA